MEEVIVSDELYVADGHSIGCGLFQYYYRPATPEEIAERAGTKELNEALELAIKRIHALEKELDAKR
jgi:hypothetical protein